MKVLKTLSASSSSSSCSHPTFLDGRCEICRQVDAHSFFSAVPLEYITKGLRMSSEEIDRRRASELKNLLSKKKLYLVLDLDHTLLHNISSLGIVKLRPFVHKFLKETSRLFELCIYTMGARPRANKMAQILDPDKRYFDFRIISREDCTVKNKKGLDVVLADESVVVIVDDTESVWDKHKSNLIPIDAYHYSPEYKTKPDDALVRTLEILKNVHKRFFDDPAMKNDVRNVLREISQDAGQNHCIASPVLPITNFGDIRQITICICIYLLVFIAIGILSDLTSLNGK